MKLHTLWKMWDDEFVELLFALDEYCIDENPAAWDEGVKKALADYSITEADTRTILIDVSHSAVVAAFRSPTINGRVLPQQSP